MHTYNDSASQPAMDISHGRDSHSVSLFYWLSLLRSGSHSVSCFVFYLFLLVPTNVLHGLGHFVVQPVLCESIQYVLI